VKKRKRTPNQKAGVLKARITKAAKKSARAAIVAKAKRANAKPRAKSKRALAAEILAAGGVPAKRCTRCNRPLKNPVSMALGIGITCIKQGGNMSYASKVAEAMEKKEQAEIEKDPEPVEKEPKPEHEPRATA
jgi:hypothetical protein